MPTSKIQAELLKSTKVDPDDYKKRQDYLKGVMDKINTFKDPQWDKMSEAAQLWMNAAIKAFKGKKPLPDYPDVGTIKPGADDESEEEAEDEEDEAPKKKAKKPAEEEDEDEDEAPKKKKKPAAEDEEEDEEEEAPKKKRKPAEEEDEEEDEAPKKKKKKPVEADEDEEEDEAPKKKKRVAAEDEEEEEEEDEAPKKKKKKAAAEEDEEEDEAPKKKKVASVPPKASGVKVAIKDAIILDPEISVDSIVKKLGKGGAEVSKVTVSNVRAEFRHTLKLLKERGKLKGIEL